MEETLAQPLPETIPAFSAPEPIFNCPECSTWLPPGSLACPECHAIVYAQHLRRLAIAARDEEAAKHWPQARLLWQQALEWLPSATEQSKAVEERIGQIDEHLRVKADNKAKWTRRLGPLAPVVYFLAKAKSLLFLLLKFKFLFSFLAFFAIYWALFGFWFGAGFTVAILLHEMGHYVAARRRGLKVDLPVFLPGFGAYVRWYAMGVSLDDLSGIALAGPFTGFLVSIGFGLLSFVVPGGYWQGLMSALAHVSAWLNLINLVPVLGLDGAQATFALDRMQRGLVLATSLIFFGWLHEWSFLFIAAGMTWRIFTGQAPEQANPRTMLRYVLLLFCLGLVVYRFPDPTGAHGW